MRTFLTACALLLPLALIADSGDFSPNAPPARIDWHESAAPHFDIRYQNNWMPDGFVFTVEGIHEKLEMTLGMLDPTVFNTRFRIALYSEKSDYVNSAFHPPGWSVGVAIPKLRILLLYQDADTEQFNYTIAHEMTHLLFESWFMQAHGMPPRWIDEGVAMLMEDKGTTGARGERWWNASRTLLHLEDVKPIARFALTEPGDSDDPAVVQRWYMQAYLMTRYLYYGRSKMQFKSFCDSLRAGHEVRQALNEVYGITDTKTFDRAWVQFAGLKSGGGRPSRQDAQYAGLRPMEFPVHFSSSTATSAPAVHRRVSWETDDSQ